MAAPRTPAILRQFDNLPSEIKSYFNDFPELAPQFPWNVTIAYLFSLVETAHNMTIYCRVVKRHKVDASLAWAALEHHHMTRPGFHELYETVFGKRLSRKTADNIAGAEKTRDRILHGKDATDNDKRQAVVDILSYSEAFNTEVNTAGGFKPFGPLRGFKGRAKSLDKSTSRWILKGIGLTLS